MIYSIILTFIFSSVSAYAQSEKLWPDTLAAKIEPTVCLAEFKNGEFIKSSLGKDDFSLFYFSAKSFDRSKKNLLYVEGGPGGVAGAYLNTLRFTDLQDWNVIYFHLRGSGCSALPASNQYDSALTISHMVDDMEAIRKHLNIPQWDIVFGVSFGTHLAMNYATQYPSSAPQLILEGYLNPMITSTVDPSDLIKKSLENLLGILQWDEFKYLSVPQIQAIFDTCLQLFQGLSTLSPDKQAIWAYGCQSAKSFGPNTTDSLMRSLIAWSIEDSIVREHLQGAFTSHNPEPVVKNKLAYASYRANIITTILGGLSSNYISLLKQYMLADIVSSAQPADPEFYINPTIVPMLELADNTANLDSTTKVLVIQGEADATTPIAATTALIDQGIKHGHSRFHSIVVPESGHQRHFTELCYKEILKLYSTEQMAPLQKAVLNLEECKTNSTSPLQFLGNWLTTD